MTDITHSILLKAQYSEWLEKRKQRTVNMGRALPVRMTTILDPTKIAVGDTIFYYRVIDKAWNRAIVIKTSEFYITLMAIDTGFKGITWHARRSALLEPDDYLFDSL